MQGTVLNGEHGDNGGRGYLKRKYDKDATIRIDVGYAKINASDIISFIEDDFGVNTVFACVPRGGYYEVTLCDTESAQVLAGEWDIKGNKYNCRVVTDRSVVVSFLHLTPYIEDGQILDLLKTYNITPLSDIKRHFLKGTRGKITDGTRYVRVRFPSNIKSLPYSVRFETCDGLQPFRVIHNGQVKTCNQCFESDHVLANCPKVRCKICHQLGHIARDCSMAKCYDCRNTRITCTCGTTTPDNMSDEESTCTPRPKVKSTDPYNVNFGEDIPANDWSLSTNEMCEKVHESDTGSSVAVSESDGGVKKVNVSGIVSSVEVNESDEKVKKVQVESAEKVTKVHATDTVSSVEVNENDEKVQKVQVSETVSSVAVNEKVGDKGEQECSDENMSDAEDCENEDMDDVKCVRGKECENANEECMSDEPHLGSTKPKRGRRRRRAVKGMSETKVVSLADERKRKKAYEYESKVHHKQMKKAAASDKKKYESGRKDGENGTDFGS